MVVDNGSTDGAPEAARACGARVIAMGRNAGFAAAVNRGIRETRAEWIAVLNSDVELAPDYFALPHRLEQAWFATGRILAADDRRASTAHSTWCAAAARRGARGTGGRTGRAWAMRRRIWSAPWTAAVFRAALFEKTGLLEERFESYLEDVDFGLRCAALGPGRRVCAAKPWPGIGGAPRWAAGIRRRCGGWRATRCGFWRGIIRGPTCCAALWPAMVAQLLWGLVALRHGAGAGMAAGESVQGLRSSPEVRQATAPVTIAELLERLRTNELIDPRRCNPTGVPIFTGGCTSYLPPVRQSDTWSEHRSGHRHLQFRTRNRRLPRRAGPSGADVVVVDNCIERRHRCRGEADAARELIANSTNRGFAAAVNQGFCRIESRVCPGFEPGLDSAKWFGGVAGGVRPARRGGGRGTTAGRGTAQPQVGFMVRAISYARRFRFGISFAQPDLA